MVTYEFHSFFLFFFFFFFFNSCFCIGHPLNEELYEVRILEFRYFVLVSLFWNFLLYHRSRTIMGSSCYLFSWGEYNCYSFYSSLCFHFLHHSWHHKNILQLTNSSNQHLRNMALDALDQSICAVLGSDRFQEYIPSKAHSASHDVRIVILFV